MRQERLLSQPVNAIKNVRKTPLIKRLLFMGILLAGIPFAGMAQSAPEFLNGTPQTLTVCENSTPTDFSSLLSILDPDVGDMETWSVNFAPSNGTLVGFPTSALSNGSILAIGPGLTYQPNAGFSGIDSFKIGVNDGTGLMDSTTIFVFVNPPPAVDVIMGFNSVCIGGTIPLTDDTTGGVWGVTNSNASISTSGLVTGLALGDDTVTYSVSGTCGVTTVTLDVAVTLLPSAGTIFGPSTVCPGAFITLFNSTSGGTWSTSNGNATVDVGGNVEGLSTGLDTIYYSVTQVCGTGISSYVVTILAEPIVYPVSGPSMVCVGDSIALIDAPPPGEVGLWYSNFPAIATAGFTTGEVYGVSSGIDTIRYRAGNDCGTMDALYLVTVNPQPVAGTITGATSVCVGSVIPLTDVGGGGGSWLASNTNATVSGGIVAGMSAGIDTIIFTVTNICGTIEALHPVTVNPLPYPGVITGLDSVCVDDSITLLNPTVPTVGTGVWSVLNPKASINSAGIVQGLAAGLDTVEYNYTNVCGSKDTTFQLTVVPLPFAGGITGPVSVCAEYAITLSDTVLYGVWSSSSVAKATVAGTGIVTGVSAGTATITYTYTNACGSVYVTHPETIIALPDSGVISGPSSVCAGNTINLVDPATGGVWAASGSGATVSGGMVTGISGGVFLISYSVTNVCRTAVAVHPVTVNVVPSAGTITGDTSVCVDDFDHLEDVIPGGIWSLSNNNLLLDSAGGISGLVEGTMDTVTYTVSNVCGSSNTTYVITIPYNAVCWHTYVNQVTNNGTYSSIYPNPATDELTIKMDQGAYKTFMITNELGQAVVPLQQLKGIETNVDIHSLPAGIYNVTLAGASGMTTKKLVKE